MYFILGKYYIPNETFFGDFEILCTNSIFPSLWSLSTWKRFVMTSIFRVVISKRDLDSRGQSIETNPIILTSSYHYHTPWSGARTQRKKNSLLYYTYFASEKCKMSLMYVVCSNINGLKKIEFSQGSKVRWFRNWSRLKATDGYNIMLYCITQGNFSLSSSSSRPGWVPYLNY